mgnify:CR=1 FL=1
MSIDILIADDEPPALAELATMLAADDRIGAIHQARSGAEALRMLSSTGVDAAFLDIHMPGLSGFDLARALTQFQRRPAVVFVTADEAGALEAFDVRAVDYVLKPVRQARLRAAVDRVLEASASSVEPTSAGEETVAATVGAVTHLVRRSDVRWVHAEGDYSRLWTGEDSHLVRIPISELEERWREAGFVRIHRSYLVHRDAITAVHLGPSATGPSVRLDHIELPVSRRLVPTVREQLIRGA